MQPTRGPELVAPATEPTWRRRGVAGWVAENALAAVTLVGLGVYGFLRFTSGVFYGRLGFSPEQVGLGYSDILARSAYVLLFLAIVSFGVIILVFLVILILELMEKRRGRKVPAPFSASNLFRESVIWFSFLGFLYLAGRLMLETTSNDVGLAKQGVPVGTLDPMNWKGNLSWPAQAPIVHPTDGGTLPFGSCVLYLGQSDGYTALFDPKTDTAWRVPSGDVTIQTGGDLSSVERVPQDC